MPDPVVTTLDPRLEAVRRSGLLGRERFERFEKLNAIAAAVIGAPVSLMSILDDDRQYFTSHFGLPDELAAARETPLSHSVCSTVVETDEVLMVDDMGGDARFSDHPARTELSVESYCGVPIRDHDGHVLGSFCVMDDVRRVWSDADVRLLRDFADIIGDYVRTSHEHHALVTDLQQRLTPADPPDTDAGRIRARYQPVEDGLAIGGDFYDWHLRSDGSIDIVLGDAVGHGIGSTQAAAQMRSAVRAVLSGSTIEPTSVLRRVSGACADLPGCSCAALTVARISPDGEHVRWARGGSLPPLLVGADSRILDGPACPPLGLGGYTSSRINEHRLAPGETIAFFTDGLIERRGESIDLGFERLVDAAATIDDLDGFVETVCPDSVRHDDAAIVTFTRRSA